jgi:hypothetical protein
MKSGMKGFGEMVVADQTSKRLLSMNLNAEKVSETSALTPALSPRRGRIVRPSRAKSEAPVVTRFRSSKREWFIREILTPAQWLPKPATRWFPHTRRVLRASWSSTAWKRGRTIWPRSGKADTLVWRAEKRQRAGALQDAGAPSQMPCLLRAFCGKHRHH